MSEDLFPAGPAMVKIDGARVRALREQKGLTQLYVATVVEVTTDTVSRWENKRYPSIKKENGLKLAEALEVDLSEILDSGETTPPTRDDAGAGTSGPAAEKTPESSAWSKKPGHLGTLIILFALLGTAWALVHYLTPPATASLTTVTRIVSPHFIPGRPLPVFLKVANPSPEAVSIILKEELPPGATLEASFPPSARKQDGTLRWLTKITGSSLFYYTIITDASFHGTLSFSGNVRDGHGGEAIEIRGTNSSRAGVHHWADSDGDNRISDEEILEVYDLLANDNSAQLDLDLLEEMWLGNGYLWHPEQQQFSILE